MTLQRWINIGSSLFVVVLAIIGLVSILMILSHGFPLAPMIASLIGISAGTIFGIYKLIEYTYEKD